MVEDLNGIRKSITLLSLSGLIGLCVIFSFLPGLSFAREDMGGMRILSPDFINKGEIPSEYTCQGGDVNPELVLEDVPETAKSLALIVDDPDAPGKVWTHWVVFDIPVVSVIKADSVPGKQGTNDFGRNRYGGPCPPSGTHRYFFTIYALDKEVNLPEGISRQQLEEAMSGHILDKAELCGLYRMR